MVSNGRLLVSTCKSDVMFLRGVKCSTGLAKMSLSQLIVFTGIGPCASGGIPLGVKAGTAKKKKKKKAESEPVEGTVAQEVILSKGVLLRFTILIASNSILNKEKIMLFLRSFFLLLAGCKL